MRARLTRGLRQISIYCICAVAALCTAAHADGDVELLTNMDYPPYIADDLPGGGLHTEIVQEAFGAAGVELKIRVMPWKRIMREMDQGRATGSFSWALSQERREKFIVSKPLFFSDAMIFTRLEGFTSTQDVESRFAEGKGTILCKPLGWTMPAYAPLLAEKGALVITRPARLVSCFDLMLAGRADFVDVPTLSAWHVLQGILNASPDPDTIRSKIHVVRDRTAVGGTSHILFTRSEAGAAANRAFSIGLEIIGKNGVLRQIIDRHLAPYPHIDKAALLEGLRRSGVLP